MSRPGLRSKTNPSPRRENSSGPDSFCARCAVLEKQLRAAKSDTEVLRLENLQLREENVQLNDLNKKLLGSRNTRLREKEGQNVALRNQLDETIEKAKQLEQNLHWMQQEKQQLQVELDAAVESNEAERCTKSDCQRTHEKLKKIQSELSRQRRSAAKHMSVMSGGEYDEPLEEFNEVFTNPDELLGMLESCLDPFEAKKTLCDIFQYAYKLCKETAFQKILDTLELLFTVSEDRRRKAALGEISRAYGLLLYVSGLKNDEVTCKEICCKIVTQLLSDEVRETCNKVGRVIQTNQKYLLKCVQVAWRFVTLPSPIIACRPKDYIPQIVDREYGYWDESTPDAVLIYTRPVVYRCYDGNCAEKGMVGNTAVSKKPEGQKKRMHR